MENYPISNRNYTYNHSIIEELTFHKGKAYLCSLDSLHCVSVIGDNADKFLQGQLSCDIDLIDEHHFNTGLLCSLKGRIIAMMDVIHCHDYQLILEKDITEKTLAVLNKVAMLSKVQLKPTRKYQALGIIGEINLMKLPIQYPENGNNVSINEKACLYRIADNMHVILLTKEDADALVNQHETLIKGSLAWHYFCLKKNRPSIYQQTQGLLLPHRLGLHQHDGIISMNKGCFRGQEIIARTHYLAKLKHNYHLFTKHTQPEIGEKIVHDGTEIGEIIDWCPNNQSQFLVAGSIKNEFVGQI